MQQKLMSPYLILVNFDLQSTTSSSMSTISDITAFVRMSIATVSSIGHEFMVGANNILSTGIHGTNEARRDRSEDTIQECAICMDEISSFDNDEPIARLSCSHIFHANCVEKWRVIGSNGGLCPVCRHSIDVVEAAPVPPRPTRNRPTQHETHRFPPVAGEPRRSLSTIKYWSTRSLMWLAGVQPSRPSRLQWDMYKVLMLAGRLMLVYVLCYLLIEQLTKPLVEYIFHALTYAFQALLMYVLHALLIYVIPITLVIIFFRISFFGYNQR